jgi:hypothetical protein
MDDALARVVDAARTAPRIVNLPRHFIEIS